MSERITLWQAVKDRLVTEQKVTPQELLVYNPVQLKIGDIVKIDHIEVAGKQFVVTEVDVYERRELGKTNQFVNYVLQDTDDKFANLRMYPVENADPYAKKHHDVLVVFPDGEQDFDENFKDNILPVGVLEIRDAEGKVSATYNRVTDNLKPYEATVTVVDDTKNPPKTEKYLYWDYFRQVNGGEEFYFVEMSNETGKFQMFRGVPVSEEDVHLSRRKV